MADYDRTQVAGGDSVQLEVGLLAAAGQESDKCCENCGLPVAQAIGAGVSPEPTRYNYLWRNKWLTADAKSIDEMIEGLQCAAAELQKMKDAGVTLDPDSDIGGDFARLETVDPQVANEFNFDQDDWGDEEVSYCACQEDVLAQELLDVAGGDGHTVNS